MTPACTAASESQPALRSTRFAARAQMIAGACACGGLSAFVFAVDPSRHAVYPQCPLYATTGLYCAGCGATRAFHALLHGRVLEALHDNALFILALPLLFFAIRPYALTAWRDNAWPVVPFHAKTVIQRSIVAFIVALAFMIARNLPGLAFDLLRPR